MAREGPNRLAKAEGAEPCRQIRNQKSHAAVARSTCPSQNVKKTYSLRRVLEVGSLKNGTRVWRKARFQVKMSKNWGLWSTFGGWKFQKWHAAVVRSTCPTEKVQSTSVLDDF